MADYSIFIKIDLSGREQCLIMDDPGVFVKVNIFFALKGSSNFFPLFPKQMECKYILYSHVWCSPRFNNRSYHICQLSCSVMIFHKVLFLVLIYHYIMLMTLKCGVKNVIKNQTAAWYLL